MAALERENAELKRQLKISLPDAAEVPEKTVSKEEWANVSLSEKVANSALNNNENEEKKTKNKFGGSWRRKRANNADKNSAAPQQQQNAAPLKMAKREESDSFKSG